MNERCMCYAGAVIAELAKQGRFWGAEKIVQHPKSELLPFQIALSSAISCVRYSPVDCHYGALQSMYL